MLRDRNARTNEIVEQCITFFKAYRDYFESQPVAWKIDQALAIGREREAELCGEAWKREVAREEIARGDLQVAASRLISQSTHKDLRRSKLLDGVDSIMRLREEARMRLVDEEQ